MLFDPHYECDNEFLKLLTRRNDVDLTIVALELARDVYPDLDFHTTLDWIDARAEELSGVVARAKADVDALRELSTCTGRGCRGPDFFRCCVLPALSDSSARE